MYLTVAFLQSVYPCIYLEYWLWRIYGSVQMTYSLLYGQTYKPDNLLISVCFWSNEWFTALIRQCLASTASCCISAPCCSIHPQAFLWKSIFKPWILPENNFGHPHLPYLLIKFWAYLKFRRSTLWVCLCARWTLNPLHSSLRLWINMRKT